MGYRAQVVTQHREYGSSIFSDWQQFEDYYYKLTELYPDSEIFRENDSSFYEIGKDVVEKEIERLSKLDGKGPFEFQSQWSGGYKDTNEDILIAWGTAFRESPENSEYVSLEWY